VKGEVKVPLARLQPADLTNAVLPSADEKMVGPTERVEEEPFLVTSEITMTLGEKVTIDTYGLVGHITGSITERSLPGEPTRATGELQVKDGTYTALARKLDIERGRLIYEVVKNLDTGRVEFVITGVSSRARIKNPVIALGFGVFGRWTQTRFYSKAGRRLARLVAEVYAGAERPVPDRIGPGDVVVAPSG